MKDHYEIHVNVMDILVIDIYRICYQMEYNEYQKQNVFQHETEEKTTKTKSGKNISCNVNIG